MSKLPLQKPTIFISSTIHDFRDLRSSLKYYLEELGYVVNMSEFNDFQREPDKNSYTACLNTVKSSDYFILLIGSRTGGIYNKTEGTTITQEEYRVAYERAIEGKTRILGFVRSEVWTVREDRNALATLLQSEYVTNGELNSDSAAKLANYASKFVTDANRIFAFINEVCRIDEMKSAVEGKGPLPPANWVHCFETFRDIVDALRVQLNVTGDLKAKILVDNLKAELLNNLAALATKNKSGSISQVTDFTSPFRKHYKLNIGEIVTVECKHVLWMIVGSAMISRPQKMLRWRALDLCIDNGVFMGFDTSSGTVQRTDMHEALVRLRVNIDQYMDCELSGELLKLSKKYLVSAKSKGTMDVDPIDLVSVINAANRLDDIITLSESNFLCLEGIVVNFNKLPRQPLSPLDGQDELLISENVSPDEILLTIMEKHRH